MPAFRSPFTNIQDTIHRINAAHAEWVENAPYHLEVSVEDMDKVFDWLWRHAIEFKMAPPSRPWLRRFSFYRLPRQAVAAGNHAD
jgi:hypothetical protein